MSDIRRMLDMTKCSYCYWKGKSLDFEHNLQTLADQDEYCMFNFGV